MSNIYVKCNMNPAVIWFETSNLVGNIFYKGICSTLLYCIVPLEIHCLYCIFIAVLHCTVFYQIYRIVLYCTVIQICTILYCIFRAVMYCTIRHNSSVDTVQYSTVHYCTVPKQYSTTFHSTRLDQTSQSLLGYFFIKGEVVWLLSCHLVAWTMVDNSFMEKSFKLNFCTLEQDSFMENSLKLNYYTMVDESFMENGFKLNS